MINNSSVIPDNEPAISTDLHFCPVCGHQNPSNVEFCLNCTVVLDTQCSVCHHTVPAGSKFCGQCGANLTDQQSEAEAGRNKQEVWEDMRALMPSALVQKISAASGDIYGEHRDVTVLFVSLTNFSTSPYLLDDEDIYFYRNEALSLLVEVVYEYEGAVDKFTEDGVMALFGAPVAHENDPERAVRAALEMQAIIQTWQTQHKEEDGLDFEVRFGLNTGLVVVGTVGNDLHMDYTVIGETVTLAAELDVAAAPGTILVSRETYRRTRSLFEFKPLAPFMSEGSSEPVQAFEPLGFVERSRQVRFSSGLQVPMIGRAHDMNRLQDVLTQVGQDGRRRVALITGEAGLGKSRLVAEFRRTVSEATASVYQGSCLAYARSQVLWVVAELLRDIIDISEADTGEAHQQALQNYLERVNLTEDDLSPYLSHVLGLDQIDPELEARLSVLDATMLQRQTHAALRQVFLAEAQRGPTVLIFEDLHWIDPASRDFIDYLMHTTDEAPLLIILVSRAAERRTAIRPLVVTAQKEPERLVDLQLQPLSKGEGQLLAGQLVTQSTPEAQTLKHRIVERAEGNPFFVEELIRMLIDQGGLTRAHTDGSWQVTPLAHALLRSVPRTVKGLILARFDRLPEGLRRVLQRAAVFGNTFPVSLLSTLNGTDPDVLTTQLDELEARQLLLAEPFRSEAGYVFRHALLQETIYDTLLKRDRSKIHTQIAEGIEHSPLWLPEERAEALAYHYGESLTPKKALPHLMTAADNAARRCAYETAIEHFRQAITLLPEQPDPTNDAYFRVRIGLSHALKFMGQFSTASQMLLDVLQHLWTWVLENDSLLLKSILVESLVELADIRQREGAYDNALAYLESGLQALGEEGAQEQPRSWYALLDRIAWIRFRQGQLDEAFDLASQATANFDVEDVEDPITVASLYNTLGGISWQKGQLDEAIIYVGHSLDLYEGVGYLWGMATAYGNLGILYYAQGNWHRATDYYEQAYAVQQVIGNPEGQAVSYDNLGILRMAMGDHETARQELEAGLAIRQRLGDAWGKAQSHINLAELAIIQSRYREAARYVTAALNLSDAIGSSEVQIQALWMLALVQAENGEFQVGLDSAQQALDMARTAGLMEKETDCLRTLGVLHARMGQYSEAETLLNDSVKLAADQNAPYRQGLAQLELGRVYYRLTQLASSDECDKWSAKAVTVLHKAATKFQTLGAVYDLDLTEALLNQL